MELYSEWGAVERDKHPVYARRIMIIVYLYIAMHVPFVEAHINLSLLATFWSSSWPALNKYINENRLDVSRRLFVTAVVSSFSFAIHRNPWFLF